jgi:hypothetical protein
MTPLLPNTSIKVKILLAAVACLVVIAAANAVAARRGFERDIRVAGERAVSAAAQSFVGIEKRELDKLATTLDALAAEPAFATLLAFRDRDRLLQVAAPIFRELRRHGVTHWSFIEPAPSRTCFLRVHRPELVGDTVDRHILTAAILTGETAAGRELGQTAFALRVVRPFAPAGQLLGYIELGEDIEGFLERMKQETGDDYQLVVHKQFLDPWAWALSRGARRNNWGDDPDVVTVKATGGEEPLGTSAEARDLPDAGRYLGRVERGSRELVRGVVPLVDAGGHRVGGLFVAHDVSGLRARAIADQLEQALLQAAVALVVLALLFLLVERLVFRRLARMTTAIQRISVRLAGGDYDVSGTLQTSGTDEIARFESFLSRFLSTIASTLRELEARQRRAR